MQHTSSAFALATGATPLETSLFLSARNFDLHKATLLFARNKDFRRSLAHFYSSHPPFPFSVLAEELFSFVPNVANDLRGHPILVVNLRFWKSEWDLDASEEDMNEMQWVVFWVVSKALELPSVQKSGLTLVSNTDNANPHVSTQNIHILLLEFILNVIPVRLSSFVISEFEPTRSLLSRFVSLVSPSNEILESYGVEIFNCNRLTLVTLIDEWNLPPIMGGKAPYDHAQWYQHQIPEFSRLDYTPPSAIAQPQVSIRSVESATPPSFVTQVVSDAWVSAANTLRSVQTKSHDASVSAAYKAILEDYNDRQLNHLSTAGRPMDEKEAQAARADALEIAKSRFGGEKDGLELLKSIEIDLTTSETETRQSYTETLYHTLLSQITTAKTRWETQIADGDLTTVDELNRKADDLLLQIRPKHGIPNEMWNSVVGSVEELVRKPLVEVLEMKRVGGGEVKGKQRAF
ncbi:hypothetical protein HDU98_008309 [Podochytrium sp. JEL0797]|nr:hypothetical protein HDU98_008309 [Podochytrium sp. JEL0797]